MAASLRFTPVHPEAARYASALICAGELWTGPEAWRGFAGYLAHRGWEAQIADLRRIDGGVVARAEALAAHARTLAAPPVLVGHGAGALAALAAAGLGPAAAVVLLAPLPPRSTALRALLGRWGVLRAVAFGRPVLPPAPPAAVLALDELPAATRAGVIGGLAADHPAAVLDLMRGRVRPAAPGATPVLLATGERDPLLPPPAAASLAATIGAEHHLLPGAGRWLQCAPGWEQCVGAVHRWIVQQLGERLLDFYAEAMAERDGEDVDE
ncbi:MAG TPA: alpha/beta fold hydrolase [Candidatus Binatia bacterium]|nr:alpha/beta fold hydrolase [Candidatus Binatia bacterium]